MIYISKSVEETFDIGKCLGELASEGAIVCLNGDLGAGKTHFAKGLAAGLGITEHITSPTYNIVNEYYGKTKFVHFDVYRIAEPEEMYDIGFDDYLNGSGVILIEWANIIAELLPEDRLEIEIKKCIDENCLNEYREISFIPKGQQYVKLVEEMKSSCTF